MLLGGYRRRELDKAFALCGENLFFSWNFLKKYILLIIHLTIYETRSES